MQTIQTERENTRRNITELSNVHKSLITRQEASNIQQESITQPDQVQQEPSNEHYKSFWPFFRISMIIVISSFQVGYSLGQISAVAIEMLINDFHITLSKGLTHGIFLGVWPIGGLVGAIINAVVVHHWTKKQIYYFIGAVNILSAGLTQVTTFYTLFFGRFFLGVCCGMYLMVAPIMTRQIVPPSLRPLFGSFYSLGRIFGTVFCFAIGLALQLTSVPNYWRIVFIMPGVLGVTQTILVFFYVPDTPEDLMSRKRFDQLKKNVEWLYKKQYTKQIYDDYIKQFEIKKERSVQQSKHKADPYEKNKKRAFYMAIHLNIYTQFIGVNTISVLAGVMMQTVDPGLALYSDLILNGIRIPPTILATFYIGTKLGRRTLYMISGVLIGISLYMTAIGYLANQKILIITFIYVYMVSFSLFYTPVNYSYPTEITPPNKITIANIFNQAFLSMSLFFPPIIIEAMNGNAYPIFLFFAIYTTCSMVYMFRCLIETKGKKYEQIVQGF